MKLFDSSKKAQRIKEMEEAVYATWGPISKRGWLVYAVQHATYRWGLPTYAIYSLLMLVMSQISKEVYPYGWPQALLGLAIFLIFGFFFGRYLYFRNEKIYRKRYPYRSKK